MPTLPEKTILYTDLPGRVGKNCDDGAIAARQPLC